MNQFTNRQALMLCVLSMSLGALFSPLSMSQAQPPQASADNGPQLLETQQPLTTPSPLSTPPRGVSPQAVGTITGQGTTGYISKFTGANAIGNSILFENGGKVGIGLTTPAGLLSIKGTASNVYPLYVLNSSAGNAILGSSSGGVGVYGLNSSATDQSGVLGETSSTSTNAAGVIGTSKATSAGSYSAGVRGVNMGKGTTGFGVYGTHNGGGIGVYGLSPAGNGVWGDSTSGIGVHGRHSATSGINPAILGETNSTDANASGVQGVVNPTSPGDSSAGVRGVNNSTSTLGSGVYGSQAGYGYGVYGTAPGGTGVYGSSDTGTGVIGFSSHGSGVYGSSSTGIGVYANSPSAFGVYASSSSGIGVNAYSSSSYGITASSSTGIGVSAFSSSGYGLRASSTSSSGIYSSSDSHFAVEASAPHGTAVYGYADNGNGISGASNSGNAIVGTSSTGYAGYFQGNVHITGTLSKGAGSFKIDHPLHPATQYLSHSFVESPDMMNIYNGNATTNRKGEVWVQMPDYFTALNRDFRYQLTPMGQFAQAIVGQEIHNNRFLIKTDKPNVKVSWLVTGVRHDAYARQNRIKVEETKTGADQGKYLYPAGFGFGKDKQIGASAPRFAARQ